MTTPRSLRFIKFTLCLLIPLPVGPVFAAGHLHEIAHYSVADSSGKDLSGLDVCDGEILTISDKNDDDVYRLDAVENGYALSVHATISGLDRFPPDTPFMTKLYAQGRKLIGQSRTDWEGISCFDDEIFLISETLYAVAPVYPPAVIRWLPVEGIPDRAYWDSLLIGIESLTVSDPVTWLGLERRPALIMQAEDQADAFLVQSTFSASAERPDGLPLLGDPDITGSDVFDNALYTLHRSAQLVCRRPLPLDASVDPLCWSYASSENAADVAYPSMRFGRAEGLAVTADRIFIVLDNNGDRRVSDGSDEALFFEFLHPDIPPE